MNGTQVSMIGLGFICIILGLLFVREAVRSGNHGYLAPAVVAIVPGVLFAAAGAFGIGGAS